MRQAQNRETRECGGIRIERRGYGSYRGEGNSRKWQAQSIESEEYVAGQVREREEYVADLVKRQKSMWQAQRRERSIWQGQIRERR